MYAAIFSSQFMSPEVSPSQDRELLYMQPMNKNSTATEEELEQHVMVGEMVMSQDDVDSQTLSILVYLFPRMS
jgi:hypothetical protein